MVKLHEFNSEENNRRATVYVEEGILYVYCYEDDILQNTINCIGHTEQYAEDTAENWVMKWGKFE